MASPKPPPDYLDAQREHRQLSRLKFKITTERNAAKEEVEVANQHCSGPQYPYQDAKEELARKKAIVAAKDKELMLIKKAERAREKELEEWNKTFKLEADIEKAKRNAVQHRAVAMQAVREFESIASSTHTTYTSGPRQNQ